MHISITLLIIVFIHINGLTQSLEGKLFSKDLYRLEISDSNLIIEEHNVLGYNLEFYSSHFKIKSNTGNEISLNIYRDSLMYYEETDSSGRFLFSGEMRLNMNSVSIQKNVSQTYNDEGIIINQPDTFFMWVKDGDWKKPLSNDMIHVSTFALGKKIEEHILISANCIEPIQVKLQSNEYYLDTVTWQFEFYLPTKNQIESKILGMWYHPKCIYHLDTDEAIWVFIRNKPTYTRYGDMRLDSNFNKNGILEGKNKFSCGTGRSQDDYFPKSKWKISNDKNLIIEESTYQILYIDDDFMILK